MVRQRRRLYRKFMAMGPQTAKDEYRIPGKMLSIWWGGMRTEKGSK